MRVFVARCHVAVRQSSEKVEIADLRSRMRNVDQRILPDDMEIQLTQMMLYDERWPRKMADVRILVIRKPERFVIVLKEVSLPQAKSRGAFEVLANVSVPEPLDKAHNLSESADSGRDLCHR